MEVEPVGVELVHEQAIFVGLHIAAGVDERDLEFMPEPV